MRLVEIYSGNNTLTTGITTGKLRGKTVNGIEIGDSHEQMFAWPNKRLVYLYRYPLSDKLIVKGDFTLDYTKNGDVYEPITWLCQHVGYYNEHGSKYLINTASELFDATGVEVQHNINRSDNPYNQLVIFINKMKDAIDTYAAKQFRTGPSAYNK